MQRPAPSTTHSSGDVDQVHRDLGLLGDAVVEALQHAAAADEVDALQDRSWASSGGASPRQAIDRVDDGADRLVDRLAHLLGRQDHRLRQTAHEIATAHLGLELVLRVGHAEPIATLISSAVRSPMAMPYSRRM